MQPWRSTHRVPARTISAARFCSPSTAVPTPGAHSMKPSAEASVHETNWSARSAASIPQTRNWRAKTGKAGLTGKDPS